MLVDRRHAYLGFCAAYLDRDLTRCATHLADDCVFALYIDRDLVPFGGVTIGKAAFLRRWEMVAANFDLLHYEALSISEDGDVLRAQVAYHFQHRATGESIEGNLRHVVTFRDTLFARAEEYLDRARVEAFFRLLATIPERP